MFNIPKNKNIVIISSPRTGSTLLAKILEQEYVYPFFNEPSQNKIDLNNFLRFEKTNKFFILKEHALMYGKNYPAGFIKSDMFVITISRRNVLEQVLSNYIALNRKKFIYSNDIEPDDIPLNKDHLLENLEFIKNYNIALSLFKENTDLTLQYEDLISHNISKIDTIPTPKPKNYDILKTWARDILEKRL